jgi:cytochrome c oxidase subunit 1
MGSQGMPRRYYSYLDQFQPLHAFSSFGSWILGLGFIVMAVYLVHSIYKGRIAGNNPWGALTLEWETTSPPDPHNFKSPPKIIHDAYDYDTVLKESTLN